MSEIEITTESKIASARISTHGATILSWVVNNNERVFLSKLSNASTPTPGKGIRGGIPIVFPNFGPWECGPQHGFARGKQWKVTTHEKQTAVLELENDEETEKYWDHKFKLSYYVKITDETLVTILTVTNNNENKSFDFTTLLHTYLRVPDVRNMTIDGLQKIRYYDSLTKEDKDGVEGEIKGIHENVDSVYKSTAMEHQLKYDNTVIKVRKYNLPDTVLWNPWIEKAKGMKDFGDEEYLEMVCIEAGKVAERQVLQAGESWKCEQVLTEA